jgi:6-phosphogluconolactonase
MAAGPPLSDPHPEKRVRVADAEVLIFASKGHLYAAAADLFIETVRRSLAARGACDIALSGGSSPKALYSLIADRVNDQSELKQLRWQNVHFFLGDERYVPPDHPDSNYGMAKSSLLKHGIVPEENLHRVRTELPPEEAAADYEQQLKQRTGETPRFDLILLGMGPDGHTASLFPDTAALSEEEKSVVANFVPKVDAYRITFTFRTLEHANTVAFLVAGADKQAAISAIFQEKANLPAAHVHPRGKLLWLLDTEAAAALVV